MNDVIEKLCSLDDDLQRKDAGATALQILNDTACEIRARKGSPIHVLEIGTFHAFTALVFAQYGYVHTLDIRSQPRTQEVVDMFPGINKNIFRYVSYNQDLLRPLMCMLPNRFFDIGFVDGCHRQASVENDLQFVRGKAPIIFCHDHRDVFPGTVKAINEFVAENGYRFTKFDEEETRGLCLLEKEI